MTISDMLDRFFNAGDRLILIRRITAAAESILRPYDYAEVRQPYRRAIHPTNPGCWISYDKNHRGTSIIANTYRGPVNLSRDNLKSLTTYELDNLDLELDQWRQAAQERKWRIEEEPPVITHPEVDWEAVEATAHSPEFCIKEGHLRAPSWQI